MNDVQLYLLEISRHKDEAIAAARKTSASLAQNELSILDLVKSLGEYLNSEDAAIRANTIGFLADVLEALPSKVLARQQRELLNDFVLSRIENGADGLGSCARALVALDALGSFDTQRVKKVVDGFLQHMNPLVQCKVQKERFEVLSLFDRLMEQHRTALKQHHQEQEIFIPQLISFFDGEKDPRNLMIIFSIFKAIMVEWDVARDSKDLFEAVFNYFPITFRPPKDDPYAITAQDLKDRLRECIAATASFAPFSFPALLDKLDSTSMNVKRDALQTIAACVRNYGAPTIDVFSVTLWDAIKFEIFNAQEDDLIDEVLAVITQISRTLSSSLHEDPLSTFLKPIVKECNDHLDDTPTKQSFASGQILYSASIGAPEASNFLVRATFPHILNLSQGVDSLPRRRGLLEVIVKIIDANLEVFGRWRKEAGGKATFTEKSFKPQANALTDSAQQVSIMLLAALTESATKEVSFKLLALSGLTSLSMIRQVQANSETIMIIKTLTDIILNGESYGKDDVKASCIDTLVAVAHQKPQLIIENALPTFMARLPDNDVNEPVLYIPALETLAKLSIESQLSHTITIRLKGKLYASLRQGSSPTYVAAITSALLWTFSNGAANLSDPTTFALLYSSFLSPLLQDIFGHGDASISANKALQDLEVLDSVGQICNRIIAPQSWVAQTEMARNTYTLFSNHDLNTIPPFQTTQASKFSPLVVSTYILAALHREAVPYEDMTALLNACIVSTLELPSTYTRYMLAQISLIVNKYTKAGQQQVIVEHLKSLLHASSPSSAQLRVAFSILKALTLRIDPLVSSILPGFVGFLKHNTLGLGCARCFAAILEPDDLLTKENHCLIYRLHKQKFFGQLVPLLIEEFNKTIGTMQETTEAVATKRNVLMALAGTIQHVPFELISGDLPRLMPLLLQSMALDEVEVQAATISTLSHVILKEPQLVEEHTTSLVNRLLLVAESSAQRNSSLKSVIKQTGGYTAVAQPKVRIAALACLGSFVGSLRRELLIPLQKRVVRELAIVLDDEKRAVRTETVRCRVAWQSLEEDDDDDD